MINWKRTDYNLPEVPPLSIAVKRSNIKDAGDGAFNAGELIPAGTYITEYSGILKESKGLTDEESDVALDVGYSLSIIGVDQPGRMAIGARLNDIIDYSDLTDVELTDLICNDKLKLLPNLAYNCQFVIFGEGVWAKGYIYATKDIAPGEEMYVEYGPAYWLTRFMRNGKCNMELADKLMLQKKREMIEKLRDNIPSAL